jgi:hypothetical protein
MSELHPPVPGKLQEILQDYPKPYAAMDGREAGPLHYLFHLLPL